MNLNLLLYSFLTLLCAVLMFFYQRYRQRYLKKKWGVYYEPNLATRPRTWVQMIMLLIIAIIMFLKGIFNL